jgi:hypothetical protein
MGRITVAPRSILLRWFVETVDVGHGHLIVTCIRGNSSKNGQECDGDLGDLAGLGRWQSVELVTYGLDEWVAQVYDQNGQAHDVATINDSATTITDAYVSGEESYNWDVNDPSTQEDQYLHMEFYNYHPKYMVWGTGFVEWPASLDGGQPEQKNIEKAYPGHKTICPAPYGATPNINNDNRYWFVGSGGWYCHVNPIF